MEPRLVPIEEVAKHFTVSISTVRTWIRQGLIPRDTYIKIGQTYRFDVPRMMEAMMKTPKNDIVDDAPMVPHPQQLELNFDQDI